MESLKKLLIFSLVFFHLVQTAVWSFPGCLAPQSSSFPSARSKKTETGFFLSPSKTLVWTHDGKSETVNPVLKAILDDPGIKRYALPLTFSQYSFLLTIQKNIRNGHRYLYPDDLGFTTPEEKLLFELVEVLEKRRDVEIISSPFNRQKIQNLQEKTEEEEQQYRDSQMVFGAVSAIICLILFHFIPPAFYMVDIKALFGFLFSVIFALSGLMVINSFIGKKLAGRRTKKSVESEITLFAEEQKPDFIFVPHFQGIRSYYYSITHWFKEIGHYFPQLSVLKESV